MEFRVLGPLEARAGDRSVALGGTRQRAVLAVLLTRAGEVVSVDRIIADLWGDSPPATAPNVVQTYVSQLRKALGPDAIRTRPGGYVADLAAGELDLHRFEGLLERGTRELGEGNPRVAAATLREALALWRGPPLGDFAYEPFAQPEIARLEELRLTATERRIEADLACSRPEERVGELEALVALHPLRERFRALLMVALYRSGRQADALRVYRDARDVLVDELGIEPSPELQELERAVLRQDPSLAAPAATTGAAGAEQGPRDGRRSGRSILLLPDSDESLSRLLDVAIPMARSAERELILAMLVLDGTAIASATDLLADRRRDVERDGVSARVAAYTSDAPGEDAALLATEQNADLVLVPAPAGLLHDGSIRGALTDLLSAAPCDVGVLSSSTRVDAAARVVVPFGGAEHDWAAIELAAWIARSRGVPLTLLGSVEDRRRKRRDASRLLARASLVLQQAAGVLAEPVLVSPGAGGVIEAARGSGLLVMGLSERWREDGVGPVRLEIARAAPAPAMFVRRGLRPGGLAPSQTLTRFTWTLASEAAR